MLARRQKQQEIEQITSLYEGHIPEATAPEAPDVLGEREDEDVIF